jgi:hypothetical protein
MRVCIIIGFALAAYINFFNYQTVAKHDVGAKRVVRSLTTS